MFVKKRSIKIIILTVFIFLLAGFTGCSQQSGTPSGVTQTPEVSPTLTETAPPPTPSPTPVPLALTVNGQGVSLAEFQAGMQQIQAAAQTLGQTLTPDEQRRRVMDDLIGQELLAQAARSAGFQVEEAALQAKVDEVSSSLGGDAALQDWQQRMGYTNESFRSGLRRSLEAAWQREKILEGVPQAVEQVHARQILVLTEAAAQQVLQQLNQAGANFATLAYGYDLSTGGDLGWFPRGYLTQPAVEEAAFSLQSGEVSAIIETDFGYHIIQVIERDENKALTPEARQTLGRKALQSWLDDQRESAQIEELVP